MMQKSLTEPFHYEPKSIRFTVFTSEQIKKLSVLKIKTPLSFTRYGHPCTGGVYDPVLGPSGNGVCMTCKHNVHQCPGHFGHIELPLPVVNPIFHRTVGYLLKLSCLHCFHLQLQVPVKLQLLAKFQLLQEGYFNELGDLQQEIEMEDRNVGDTAAEAKLEYLSEIVNRHLETVKNKDRFKERRKDETLMMTRSINIQWQTYIEDYLKQKIITGRVKVCIFCNTAMPVVKVIKDKILISTKSHSDDSDDRIILKKELEMIMPNQAKEFFRRLWANESDILKIMQPCLSLISNENPTDIFFFDVIPVLPPAVRPANYLNNEIMENPQSQAYKSIIHDCLIINSIVKIMKGGKTVQLLEEERALMELVRGKDLADKLNASWQKLQIDVDHLMDRELNKTSQSSNIVGLKQIIEKKEGIIRMHMMGKRVNYSARSVITPDPNLNVDEIGVPEAFAKKLTYPVAVTPYNVTELRNMLMNGPDVYPGAVLFEDEDGKFTRLDASDLGQREAIAKRLFTTNKPNKVFTGIKTVYRHLTNGDLLLLNRQPTLHKPSIMAHKARILKDEKTLRLHYANCKHYNCDFDGDEMNIHFLQNELCRSEAFNIATVCNQYLSPKDGAPLSGLIQDHIIGGVRMSMRGKFFNRTDYMNLVWSALNIIQGEIKTLQPAILKPVALWSGKQVISTVIINIIPRGKPLINLTNKSKIEAKEWQSHKARTWKYGGTPFKNANTMTEAEVVIRQGELLNGVLDKAHYGSSAFGLVHGIYELYGSEHASKLLSAFGKLFQSYLQRRGFSLGIRDILVLKENDEERKQIISELRTVGPRLHRSILQLNDDATDEQVATKMHENYMSDPAFRGTVDLAYKKNLNKFANRMNKTCIPNGLLIKFPSNSLQMMIKSGAKGSMANHFQISSQLGQVSLEGKRPPLMISGKSAPRFKPYDPSPMAGGFVERRFLTGIKHLEFFFHCMAGREGLIDTAVKTSRTGYLQRCMIKHFEGINVHYDMTVRDSDGSLIQTVYGEDGLDITNSPFLCKEQLEFLVENKNIINDERLIADLKENTDSHEINKQNRAINRWKKKYGDPTQKRRMSGFTEFCKDISSKSSAKYFKILSNGRTKNAVSKMRKWTLADNDIRDKYMEEAKKCPDPAITRYKPNINFGVLPETLDAIFNNYLQQNHPSTTQISKSQLKDLISTKFQMALCAPGEPVGILAAQSIGEPSTQMTLNTFHHAGQAAMNVTLGIPRLREIIMMASKNIKTPFMQVPFKSNLLNEKRMIEKMCLKLNKCTMADVIDTSYGEWKFSLSPQPRNEYTLLLKFKPYESYKKMFILKPKKVIEQVEKLFFVKLLRVIARVGKLSANIKLLNVDKESKANTEEADAQFDYADGDDTLLKKKTNLELDKADESEEEEMDEDADATTARMASRQKENEGYDEDPDDEEQIDDPDAEDTQNEDVNHSEKQNDKQLDDDEEDDEEGLSVNNQLHNSKAIEDRIQNVINSSPYIINYDYDRENHLWCKVTFWLSFLLNEMRLQEIIRTVTENVVLWEVPGLKKAFVTKSNDGTILNTDGINFGEIFKHQDVLDVQKLYANDIYMVSQTYGIEAANRVLINEIRNTFKTYDIFIDYRHLSLIADVMMFDGTFKPLNRIGMMDNPSPLQQMSFECPHVFLKNATSQGKFDSLSSPSSRIMIGLPVKCGTGIMDTFTDVKKYVK